MLETVGLVGSNGNADRRSDQRVNKNATWIYFINYENRRIRIGHSTKGGEERLKQHRSDAARFTGDQGDLDLLCQVRGIKSDEKAVQRYFSKELVPGTKETFEASERLVKYVRWLRDQYFVGMPDTTKDDLDRLDSVGFEAWMPTEIRQKEAPSGWLPIMFDAFQLGPRDTTGDDFYTPPEITAAARDVMGRIDTDPASHAVANGKVRATTFYTIADDGLRQPWNGRVWMNPPFSDKGLWANKLLGEIESGRTTEVCFLQQTRALTAQYMTPVLRASTAICIFDGRFKFWGPKAMEPNDGHFVLYIGPNADAFRTSFGDLGTVFINPSCSRLPRPEVASKAKAQTTDGTERQASGKH